MGMGEGAGGGGGGGGFTEKAGRRQIHSMVPSGEDPTQQTNDLTSVQLKVVPTRSGKPIYAPSCSREFSTSSSLFKTLVALV